jgi:hypothetical protein
MAVAQLAPSIVRQPGVIAQAAPPSPSRRSAGVWVGVGLGVVAVGGGVAWYLTHRPAAPSTPPPTTGGGTTPVSVSLSFSGGPSGQVTDPQGGHLPDLVTVLTNPGSVPATVQVSVAIQTAGGGSTPFKWFAYAGQAGLTYNADRSQVTVTVPAGGSVSIRWGTTWSGNPGSYENVATVEGSSVPSQTFVDPTQFSIVEPAPPAAANLTFSGGPSGQVTDPQGGHLPDLYTTLQNTGGQAATFSVAVNILTSGGASTPFKWFAYTGQSGLSYNSDNSQVSVTLQPGQSIQIRWGTTWSGNVGSYENVATVSW